MAASIKSAAAVNADEKSDLTATNSSATAAADDDGDGVIDGVAAAPAPKKPREVPVIKRKLNGYVGFANLPKQWHRKSIRRGFSFNLMVVGTKGLGKSTLINTLFNKELYKMDESPKVVYPDPEQPVEAKIETVGSEIEENNVKLNLSVIDCPGFGENIDNTQVSWKPIVDEINRRFDQYLEQETKVNRSTTVDNRVHALLYFIEPTGHSLKPLDIEFMKQVHQKVNLIPVIARSDTLTEMEVSQSKQLILDDIKNQGITLFNPPIYDNDDDETASVTQEMVEKIPFAVVGSTNYIQTPDGRTVRGRSYPWGIIEVDNEEDCDLIKLRQLLVRNFMEELKETTSKVLYERYRTEKLAKLGIKQDDSVFREFDPVLKQEEEKQLHEAKLSNMEAQMRSIFKQKVTREEKKLQETEADLFSKHKEMREKLLKQIKLLEEKKKDLEKIKSQQTHSSPQINVTSDLYNVLGVAHDASPEDIRRAYRKLALRYHPDKVGESEREAAEIRFKEITQAYSIIGDSDKRRDYDIYGERVPGAPPPSGPESYGFGGAAFDGADFDFSPNDFANFFNGMNTGGGMPGMGGAVPGMDGESRGRPTSRGFRGPSRGPPKGKKHEDGIERTEDAHFNVEVIFLDLYNGKVVKLSEERDRICDKCKGKGVKKSAVEISCSSCNSTGYERRYRHIGGLSIVETIACSKCNGQGTYYREKDYCKRCKGTGVVKESKILEFAIPKGSANEGSIVLRGESDQSPGLTTGDVILEWKLKPTDKESHFERHGDDLYTKVRVPLVDALCGFSRDKFVETLDNRWLSIKMPQGKVLRPGDSIIIPNEGMPVCGNYRNRHGDLYVAIDIEFPKDDWAIEKNDITSLKSILDIKYGTKGQNSDLNDNSDVTNVWFKVKGKSELPVSFNSYNANAVVNSGVDERKGWFGRWF
ncbi:hypothetical protein FOA43_002875 [Brettanomyces nanus]|uniref:Uncharacterized protein n=1 Tax=Eeniella nana TaxID=13502 RepID=A0A875RPV9_EENNA|nr:uncharacterized protein FOA43_002875 [Brettanomyces nanus]QPG75520.1 hypothetical protein FOA43_002875 [Brettanomyces nanus]